MTILSDGLMTGKLSFRGRRCRGRCGYGWGGWRRCGGADQQGLAGKAEAASGVVDDVDLADVEASCEPDQAECRRQTRPRRARARLGCWPQPAGSRRLCVVPCRNSMLVSTFMPGLPGACVFGCDADAGSYTS